MIPKMRVQRQGKKWRIVLDATRTLAKFNSGDPCDGGGFLDEFDDQGQQTVDGRFECQKQLQVVIDGQKQTEPAFDDEMESIGH